MKEKIDTVKRIGPTKEKAYTRAGYTGACLGKGIRESGDLMYNENTKHNFYNGVLSEMPEDEIILYAIFYLQSHCSRCKDLKECDTKATKCNLYAIYTRDVIVSMVTRHRVF